VPAGVHRRPSVSLKALICGIFGRRRTGENVPLPGWQCGGQGVRVPLAPPIGVPESLGCKALRPILKPDQLVAHPSAESRSCRSWGRTAERVRGQRAETKSFAALGVRGRRRYSCSHLGGDRVFGECRGRRFSRRNPDLSRAFPTGGWLPEHIQSRGDTSAAGAEASRRGLRRGADAPAGQRVI
jgi:hypothetical protein